MPERPRVQYPPHRLKPREDIRVIPSEDVQEEILNLAVLGDFRNRLQRRVVRLRLVQHRLAARQLQRGALRGRPRPGRADALAGNRRVVPRDRVPGRPRLRAVPDLTAPAAAVSFFRHRRRPRP